MVPAIIAGSVGLASTILSTLIALYTINKTQLDRQQSRSQDIAIAILPRRLDALQQTWKHLYKFQITNIYSNDYADELIEAAMWLPSNLRQALLSALRSSFANPEQVKRVQSMIIDAAAVSEIDVALKRLSEKEAGRVNIRRNH